MLGIGLAIAELAFAYGAWTLKPWAWALGIIAALANLLLIGVIAVVGGDIVNAADRQRDLDRDLGRRSSTTSTSPR